MRSTLSCIFLPFLTTRLIWSGFSTKFLPVLFVYPLSSLAEVAPQIARSPGARTLPCETWCPYACPKRCMCCLMNTRSDHLTAGFALKTSVLTVSHGGPSKSLPEPSHLLFPLVSLLNTCLTIPQHKHWGAPGRLQFLSISSDSEHRLKMCPLPFGVHGGA